MDSPAFSGHFSNSAQSGKLVASLLFRQKITYASEGFYFFFFAFRILIKTTFPTYSLLKDSERLTNPNPNMLI